MQPNKKNPPAPELKPGETEMELGVAIPGVILPAEQWATNTAIHRLPPGPIHFPDLFQRMAPVVLDIGCGNGRFVISSAVRRPECDHIGIDILPLVIRYATRRGKQRGLSNTRFAVCGGFEFLSKHVLPSSVAEIHIYHPQPFHDPHQRELRLLRPEFMKLLHQSLSAEGKVFLQTDSQPYWKYASEVFATLFDWQIQEGPWAEDPLGRSRREIIALQKGLPIFRGWGARNDALTEPDVDRIVANLPRPEFATSRPKRRR